MRRMAIGKRQRDRQLDMWVATTELPTAARHPFYRRLNQSPREHGFDDFVETQCAGFYGCAIFLAAVWTGRRRNHSTISRTRRLIATCAKTRSQRLRGLAVVELEQAAESFTTLHLTRSNHGRRWRDELVA